MSGIRSSDLLREPEQWRAAPTPRGYFSAVAGVVLTVSSFAIAAYEYSVGRAGIGTGGLCFGILFALALVLAIDGQFCFRESSSQLQMSTAPDGARALLIPYSNIQFVCTLLATTYVGFLVLIFGFIVTENETSTINPELTIFVVAACVFWSFTLLVVTRRYRRGWLALTSDGIYQRGWAFEAFAPWSSITIIDPLVAQGPAVMALVNEDDPRWRRKYFTRLWRQDQIPKKPAMLVFAAKDLGIDIVLVYRLVDYYYHYPASRSELSTDTALERARQANFI